jgi:DNA-binding XRE family transcriptional regulator
MIKNQIAEFRAKVGKRDLNKSELASRLGVSRSYITRLEQGKSIPGLPVAFKLAACLGVNVCEVFSWEAED